MRGGYLGFVYLYVMMMTRELSWLMEYGMAFTREHYLLYI